MKKFLSYTLIFTFFIGTIHAASEKIDDERFRVGAEDEIEIDAGPGDGMTVITGFRF